MAIRIPAQHGPEEVEVIGGQGIERTSAAMADLHGPGQLMELPDSNARILDGRECTA